VGLVEYQRKLDVHGGAASRRQELRLLQAMALPLDMLHADSGNTMRSEVVSAGAPKPD
jgi:hypothetical protein